MSVGQDTRSDCSSKAELIRMLRGEASEVKACFTQYSFQALAVAAVGLGAIAQFQRSSDHAYIVADCGHGFADTGRHRMYPIQRK